jgi:hypothetical protein
LGEAANGSAVWIGAALAFCAGQWAWLDASAERELANLKAAEFLAGHLIEKSLAVVAVLIGTSVLASLEWSRRRFSLAEAGGLMREKRNPRKSGGFFTQWRRSATGQAWPPGP